MQNDEILKLEENCSKKIATWVQSPVEGTDSERNSF